MKIFLDTSDIDEIKEAMACGLIDGVTTNPSLIKKAQEKHKVEDMRAYIKEILKICKDKPVSIEVTETSYEGMKAEAMKIRKLFGKFKNLVIKVPVNPSMSHDNSNSCDGLKLIGELAAQGIAVNVTVVMSPEQAVLAAKAGATYVSPFAGRIDDYLRTKKLGMQAGKDFDKMGYYPADGWPGEAGTLVEDNGIVSGVDLVWNIVQIFKNYNFNCQVLAASVRNPRQVRECMLAGSHVATLPFKILMDMTAHFMTVEGVVGFARDTVPEYANLLKDHRRFAISLKKD